MSTIPFALIFDMDGTLMDNNPYHLQAWKAFCRSRGMELTDDRYRIHISGRKNPDIFQYLFGNGLSDIQVREMSQKKEALYRELYQPVASPLPGLMTLLALLRAEKIPTGIATSATPENIAFAMDLLAFHPWFDVLVDSTGVKKGKPDPEIFLKTARMLGTDPACCLVFEDSLSGIRGAVAAGMTAVGITTTHSAEELKEVGAQFCIRDYTEIDLGALKKFMIR